MSEKMPKVKKTLYTTVFKRFFDIALSGIAILFLSPVFIVISLLELVFHGYPIFFSQDRPGLHGEIFKLWKFRSMTNAKDKTGKLLPSEQRLTPFGKFIRRFSLDRENEYYWASSAS